MYINITDSETGNNKGSSGQLVNYLEKENRAAPEEDHVKELWFNTENRKIMPQEARVRIDNNIAKLGRRDAKFFLVNISPSQKEIVFLKERFGAQVAEEKLKQYAVLVMDAYAHNFKRPGIQDSRDLLWYGKLERYRYYSFRDPEVEQGIVKAGERKTGEQMHIQIIVSRKDISNKIKLSPMNNSRGSNKKHSQRLGQFDRVSFKSSGELIFDQMFGFDRSLKDTMNYALTMKNGTAEQKREINLLDQLQSRLINSGTQGFPDTAKDIFQSQSSEPEQLTDGIGLSKTGLLNILSSPDPLMYENMEDQITGFKKKKKKKRRPPGT
ncbi:DUF5712 family protein [Flavobacterium sp. LHD-85]|uniref:DUF5712 family protein n=1 Tax=Flavobacterium sp. LHD-85 TaxID=3071410 RepID=UPI0027E05072|nr:DUF5712 family protein [Flavobacterium sp. LHD-85]MDQ6527660.1 DUF5712 family protein [Flavobacterium sp. LHD-85]